MEQLKILVTIEAPDRTFKETFQDIIFKALKKSDIAQTYSVKAINEEEEQENSNRASQAQQSNQWRTESSVYRQILFKMIEELGKAG